MYVILVYDIRSDSKSSKIWRKTFQICKRYLVHIQNSVFEGEIDKSQLIMMEAELKKIIRKDKDTLIIFKSRNEKWIPKDILGLKVEDDVFL